MASEQILAASPNYMHRHGTKELSQQFLEPSMRTVTVSWLVEVPSPFHSQILVQSFNAYPAAHHPQIPIAFMVTRK